MQRIVITGASRGIGLELVRQYAERGDTVFAGCRDVERASDLRQLAERHGARVHMLPLTVDKDDAVADAARQVRAETNAVDVLINNAAINPGDTTVTGPGGQQIVDAAGMLEVLRVNTVAPLIVAQTFLELLRAGTNPRLVNISSGAGSMTYKTGGSYVYSTSKAALNMVTRGLAGDLRAEGIAAVAIDPGWVKTDMGGHGADLEPHESVQGLLSVIDSLTLADTGHYLRYDGSTVPW